MERIKTKYTRKELVALCEQAIIPFAGWDDRDHPEVMKNVGTAWAWLKAGCKFQVILKGDDDEKGSCFTDEETVWIQITTFHFNDNDIEKHDTFYLPTKKVLAELAKGKDKNWY